MKPTHTLLFVVIVLFLGMIALTGCATATGSGQNNPNLVQPTDDSYNCSSTTPSPIGQNIADTYSVTYDTIMAWFCSGFSFENILIALETSEAVDVPAETLLRMLLDKEWEEIWVEVGFTDGP